MSRKLQTNDHAGEEMYGWLLAGPELAYLFVTEEAGTTQGTEDTTIFEIEAHIWLLIYRVRSA